ncbi:hypothetical protein K469DRAFT_748796 [Zopfia rhizophila CBS 207.26]|uniref:Heterokaryon incompatibility domain-containing protein n=1 Tax=Zopfia rhizophila CBS 207.26 TaxID=1314779 RepID=A0A6A6ECZ0_9PEZI|nr:hypothetical protein K469DRAFT_748796 [Zopfia rhizophila CBS 207.26]
MFKDGFVDSLRRLPTIETSCSTRSHSYSPNIPRSSHAALYQGPTKRRKITDDEPPEKHRYAEKQTLLRHENGICQECRQLNLQKVINIDISALRMSDHGVLLRPSAKDTEGLREAAVLFAAFFPELYCDFRFDNDDTYGNEGEYELRAFAFLNTFIGVNCDVINASEHLEAVDSISLLIVPPNSCIDKNQFWDKLLREGYAICYDESRSRPEAFTAKIVPRHFDHSLVEQWVGYCKAYHKKLCGRTDIHIPKLSLIDYERLVIVPAPPSATYVALSYVWGSSGMTSGGSISCCQADRLELPASLPNLITDSIKENADNKHEQIQHMDLMYRNAEVTLVAAAGEDDTFGLPGVGTRS